VALGERNGGIQVGGVSLREVGVGQVAAGAEQKGEPAAGDDLQACRDDVARMRPTAPDPRSARTRSRNGGAGVIDACASLRQPAMTGSGALALSMTGCR
jgi:hypothetical protein